MAFMRRYKLDILIIALFICYILLSHFTTNNKTLELLLRIPITVLIVWLITKRVNLHNIFGPTVHLKLGQMILFILLSIYLFGLILLHADNLVLVGELPWQRMLQVITAAILAGVFEEYFCRGYLFGSILRWQNQQSFRLTIAAFGSALIFGCTHFNNFIVGAGSFTAVTQQVFYATCIGIVFAAIRVGSKGLTMGVLAHIIIDLQPQLLETNHQSGPWLAVFIIFLPVAVISLSYFIWLDQTTKKQTICV